ncbi:uncharacterized transposon-derived protein F54H12.3 [Trichonephila clavipes]|uniref:Uncharacterized transposon-derived protein F54H12.3 n=1 Tax=Trichonephila clavipes TaxID=2585209 RepID=A0A8X6VUT1_TRICX|nr:uncharacterized transposon-derived protein F54H12.3 [Trichonephila clavipes]
MALVPQELVSEYYQLSIPEIRSEDDISNLLKEKETPDDVKAKLLSDLIPKYQRAMKPIQSTTPFEIPSELLAEPSPFGGVRRLSKASGARRHDVQKWLSQQDVYTLHKPVRYKFQRRKTIASAYGVNELWQSDLLDMQKLSRHNKGYRYILTIIDVLSRYLRAFPIKDKKAKTIAQVFAKLFKKSAHGFESAKVTTADEPELYKRLYHSSSNPQFRFAANDTVRIKRSRDIFRKGYMPGEIEGRFYNEELQKIDKLTDSYWAIEKVIRSKGRGSSRQLLKKWVGLQGSLNSWIRAYQILQSHHNESECE